MKEERRLSGGGKMVRESQLQGDVLEVGTLVRARFAGKGHMYPAKIGSINSTGRTS